MYPWYYTHKSHKTFNSKGHVNETLTWPIGWKDLTHKPQKNGIFSTCSRAIGADPCRQIRAGGFQGITPLKRTVFLNHHSLYLLAITSSTQCFPSIKIWSRWCCKRGEIRSSFASFIPPQCSWALVIDKSCREQANKKMVPKRRRAQLVRPQNEETIMPHVRNLSLCILPLLPTLEAQTNC